MSLNERQPADYVALVEAVQKLHTPVSVDVAAPACANEDCDHEDADECLAACSQMLTCDHCNEIRGDAAHWAEWVEILPWPCPTAALWMGGDDA